MSAHSPVHRKHVLGLLSLILISALVLAGNLHGVAAPLPQGDAPSGPAHRVTGSGISLAPGAEAYRFVAMWGLRLLPRITFGFDGPGGVAVDPAGNIYVADTGHNRIQKLTADGGFVTGWGSAGSGEGEFSAPEFLAVDPAGYLYVADKGNFRIQKFTRPRSTPRRDAADIVRGQRRRCGRNGYVCHQPCDRDADGQIGGAGWR